MLKGRGRAAAPFERRAAERVWIGTVLAQHSRDFVPSLLDEEAMDHRSRMLALLLVLAAACGSSGLYMQSAPPRLPLPERHGSVEWVRETVQRTDGRVTNVAALGSIGVATETVAANHDSYEERTYHVAVRFSDGAQQVFVFVGQSPFDVGDEVAMTPAGLRRVGPSLGPQERPGLSLPLP